MRTRNDLCPVLAGMTISHILFSDSVNPTGWLCFAIAMLYVVWLFTDGLLLRRVK